MDEREFLAQQFQEHRTRLRSVAYRMLGSLGEADDAAEVSTSSASVRLSRSQAFLHIEVRPALVNGAAGTVTLRDGRPFAIAGYRIRDRRIVEMDILADPERLQQIGLTVLD